MPPTTSASIMQIALIEEASDGLLLAEAIVRMVGIVAAATVQTNPASRKSVFGQFSGGISTGAWLFILRQAQTDGCLGPFPELSAIRFKKRGVGALLQSCVEIRNRVKHAPAMMTNAEEAAALAELEPILYEVLERSTWLSQYEFLLVNSCEFTGARHEVHANRLNGSHPDWEPALVPVNEPVAPNFVYLDTPGSSSLLRLHPLASVLPCQTCRRDEFYVLDRVKESGAGEARSLRDHRVELDIRTWRASG